jgi:hypothetical protein
MVRDESSENGCWKGDGKSDPNDFIECTIRIGRGGIKQGYKDACVGESEYSVIAHVVLNSSTNANVDATADEKTN